MAIDHKQVLSDAFRDAGLVEGYEYDEYGSSNDLASEAYSLASAFMGIYEHEIEKLPPRVELEMMHAYAIGFIDAVERVVPPPINPMLYLEKKEDAVRIVVVSCSLNVEFFTAQDDKIARSLLDW